MKHAINLIVNEIANLEREIEELIDDKTQVLQRGSPQPGSAWSVADDEELSRINTALEVLELSIDQCDEALGWISNADSD
jgi:hypothetical protein